MDWGFAPLKEQTYLRNPRLDSSVRVCRMPKIAILSDIHGNLPAFQAVLKRVAKSGAQEIAFGGDIVGYGASPADCVDLVRNLKGPCVLGNHDAYTKDVAEKGEESLYKGWEANPVWAGAALAVRQMTRESLEWLWGRPWFLHLEGAVLAHASLHDINNWPYLEGDESAAPTLAVLKEKGFGLGFFGHIHRLGIYFDKAARVVPEQISEDKYLIPKGSVCAVTVGSVGQSREEGDDRATWVTWDPDERIVEFHRNYYSSIRAAREIIEAGLPMESAMRLMPANPRQSDEDKKIMQPE